MPTVSLLLEFDAPQEQGFGPFTAALESASEAESQAESLLDRVAGLGLEVEKLVPVPMFTSPEERRTLRSPASPPPRPTQLMDYR